MKDKSAFSVLGLFDSPQLLMQAIPQVKEKVAGRLDAYSPYPIHGIEKALGLRKSPITGMVLVMGILGAFSGLATTWTRPCRSRKSMKVTPPWSRRRCTQPDSETV